MSSLSQFASAGASDSDAEEQEEGAVVDEDDGEAVEEGGPTDADGDAAGGDSGVPVGKESLREPRPPGYSDNPRLPYGFRNMYKEMRGLAATEIRACIQRGRYSRGVGRGERHRW